MKPANPSKVIIVPQPPVKGGKAQSAETVAAETAQAGETVKDAERCQEEKPVQEVRQKTETKDKVD